ncbi:MAG TPA: TadE/TadG family type IV pilus assembly protein [Candidatus Sulfopaludibacter sp.]|nr:TadE/TadG family type IV pilus assembly protein [Candidatus Sulfopaludibacter sp.]
MKRQRGSTLVESAFAVTSFAVLLAGIMEVAFTGFVANNVTFAAQKAARYAAVRGTASGHSASLADVQGVAQSYAAPLTAGSVTVNVTWTPDHNPGSTVQVQVQFSIKPEILPISGGILTLQSTARQTIVQ